MNPTHDERAILRGIAADIEAILVAGVPSGYDRGAERVRHHDAFHGLVKPRYSAWLGYPCDEPAMRMRCSRMVARLAKAGLLERVCEGATTRLTHLRLTDQGRELAQQFRAEANHD